MCLVQVRWLRYMCLVQVRCVSEMNRLFNHYLNGLLPSRIEVAEVNVRGVGTCASEMYRTVVSMGCCRHEPRWPK